MFLFIYFVNSLKTGAINCVNNSWPHLPSIQHIFASPNFPYHYRADPHPQLDFHLVGDLHIFPILCSKLNRCLWISTNPARAGKVSEIFQNANENLAKLMTRFPKFSIWQWVNFSKIPNPLVVGTGRLTATPPPKKKQLNPLAANLPTSPADPKHGAKIVIEKIR